MTEQQTKAPAERKGLRRVSLAATLALTSHAEFAAGVAAEMPLWHPFGADRLPLGLPWLLPVAIDCYVVDALERKLGWDRWAALGILALSVIGGSAYTADTGAEALKAAGVGVVLVLVLSRLYAPAKPPVKQPAKQGATTGSTRGQSTTTTQVNRGSTGSKAKGQSKPTKPATAPAPTTPTAPSVDAPAAPASPGPHLTSVAPPGQKMDRDAALTWIRAQLDMDPDLGWRRVAAHTGAPETTAKRWLKDEKPSTAQDAQATANAQ